jgi:hypothetical protein
MAKTSEIEDPIPASDLARERQRAAHRIRASARAYVSALLATDPQAQEESGSALEEAGRILGEIDQAIELSDLAGRGPSGLARSRSDQVRAPHVAGLLSIPDAANVDPRRGVPIGELVASSLSLLFDAAGMDPFHVSIRSGIPEGTIRSLLDGEQPATLATVASVGRAAGGQLIFGFVPQAPIQDDAPMTGELEAAALAFAADPERGRRALIRAALRLAAKSGVPGAAVRAESESLRSLRDLVLAIREEMSRGSVPEEIRSVDSLDAALARRAIYAHVDRASDDTERALSSRSVAGISEPTSPRWVAQRPLLLRAIFAVREVRPGHSDDESLTMEVYVDDRKVAQGSTLDIDRALRAQDVEVHRGEQIIVRTHDVAASWLTIVPIVVWK